MSHHITVCQCGKMISQCRCPSKDKQTIVSDKPCNHAKKVASEDIERIVGKKRYQTVHWGRFVSEEKEIYILHSQKCLNSNVDLRDCEFSILLGNGDVYWESFQLASDRPVKLEVHEGSLVVMPPDWIFPA